MLNKISFLAAFAYNTVLASPFQSIGKNLVEWNEATNAREVEFSTRNLPQVILEGRLTKAVKIHLDGKEVPLQKDRTFTTSLALELKPKIHVFHFFKPEGGMEEISVTYRWVKEPPIIRTFIKNGEPLIETSDNISGRYPAKDWIEIHVVDETTRMPSDEGAFTPASFFLNPLLLLPSVGGNSTAFQFAWAPWYSLSRALAIQGVLGWSVQRWNPTTLFHVFELALLASYRVLPIYLELGPGMIYWAGYGGGRPAFFGHVALPVPWKLMGVELYRVFAGYGLHFHSSAKIHQVKLGVGFRFN